MAILSQVKSVPVLELKHGLFADRTPREIPPGGCESCSNLVYADGKVKPRPGFAEILATGSAVAIQHASPYYPLVGSPHIMRATRSGTTVNLYRYSGGWSASLGSYASATASDIVPSSANFKGGWYYAAGEHELLVYDGSTVVTVESLQSTTAFKPPDNPRLVAANDSRLFLANVLNDSGTRIPYRVCWSDFLNANVWNGGVGAGSSGFQDLASASDSYGITALYAMNEMILVFKRNATYIGRFVGGRKTYEFRPLYRGVGCIAPKTIRELENGALVWLGDDTIYYAFPGQQPQSIGEAVHNRIRTQCSLTQLGRAVAIFDRASRIYWLVIPEVSTDRACILFGVNLKDYGWWEGRIAGSGTTLSISDTYEVKTNWGSQMVVASEDGKIYEFSFSNTSDNGTAFTTSWVSGIFSVLQLTNGQAEHAMVQSIRAFSDTGTVVLSVLRGDGVDRFTETPFGTQTFDGSASVLKGSRADSAEHFKLKFTHSSVATAAPIWGLQVGLKFMGTPRSNNKT